MTQRTLKMTWLEAITCRVLGCLRYDADENFYKCRHNDMVLALARVLLGGRDPLDFARLTLEEAGLDMNDVAEQFERLR